VLPDWLCPVVVQVIIVKAAAPADPVDHVVAVAEAEAEAAVVVDVAAVVDPESSLPGTDRCIEGMDT